MLQITHINVGYNETEDRLAAACVGHDGTAVNLLLTQRITRRMVDGLSEMLAKSSMTAQRTPTDMREDLLAFEHQSATRPAEPAPGHSAPRPIIPVARQPDCLVSRVDVIVAPTNFTIEIFSGERPVARLVCTRNELHCLIALLLRRADLAEWSIRPEANWLRAGVQVSGSADPNRLI